LLFHLFADLLSIQRASGVCKSDAAVFIFLLPLAMSKKGAWPKKLEEQKKGRPSCGLGATVFLRLAFFEFLDGSHLSKHL
jgi:hypothetical protein